MKREELLKSREYWITHIQLGLFELIENYRLKNGLNKAELARELGVSKSYITQVLNGDFDHKLSKLVDMALAFGKVPVIRYEDIEQHIEEDKLGITVVRMNPATNAELKSEEIIPKAKQRRSGLRKKD